MNYYIQGDVAKAEQIKAAFERLGYDTSFVQKLSASDSHILFTLPCDIRVHAFHTAYIEADILKRLVDIDPDYKELELSKPHYDTSNFQPFDKVLVRCGNDEEWMIEFYCKYDTLVHTSPHRDYPFMGIGDSYSQCIPFNDDTKHLLGTTDMPDECYINW